MSFCIFISPAPPHQIIKSFFWKFERPEKGVKIPINVCMLIEKCFGVITWGKPSSEFRKNRNSKERTQQYYKLFLCWLLLVLLGIKTIEIRGRGHKVGDVIGLVASGWKGLVWGEAKVVKVEKLTSLRYTFLRSKHRVGDSWCVLKQRYDEPHALYFSNVIAYKKPCFFNEKKGSLGNPGNLYDFRLNK